jgi:hypothetical protein
MPAMLAALLASPKTWVVLATGLILTFAGVQSLRLAHAKSDLAGARAALIDPATRKTWRAEASASAGDLARCRSALSDAGGALTAQAAGVATLKAESDRRAAAAAGALRATQAALHAAQARAAALMSARPGADACQSADALILGNRDQ